MQILLIYISLDDVFPSVDPSFFACVSMSLLLTLQSHSYSLSSLVFFAFPDGPLCFLTSPLPPTPSHPVADGRNNRIKI